MLGVVYHRVGAVGGLPVTAAQHAELAGPAAEIREGDDAGYIQSGGPQHDLGCAGAAAPICSTTSKLASSKVARPSSIELDDVDALPTQAAH